MHEFPYFDEIIARHQANDPSYQEAFSRNVHFGFWSQPQNALASLSAYAAATEELSRQIFRAANIVSGQSILDVGCGFGGTVARLDAEYEKMNLVGLNIDPRQIEIAQKLCPSSKRGNQIKFVVADAAQTGEPDKTFDCVLAIEVIFHFTSRVNFFNEVNRILKPGGTLLVTEIVLNPIRLPLALLKLVQNIPQLIRYKESIGDLGDPVTIGNYRKLANQTGFEIDVIENWSAQILPSFACLKGLNTQITSGKKSLYAPKLLDFVADLLEKQVQQYLAIRLRKTG